MKCKERHRAISHSRRSSQCDSIDITDNIVSSKLPVLVCLLKLKLSKRNYRNNQIIANLRKCECKDTLYTIIIHFVGSTGYAYRRDNRNIYISPIDTYS